MDSRAAQQARQAAQAQYYTMQQQQQHYVHQHQYAQQAQHTQHQAGAHPYSPVHPVAPTNQHHLPQHPQPLPQVSQYYPHPLPPPPLSVSQPQYAGFPYTHSLLPPAVHHGMIAHQHHAHPHSPIAHMPQPPIPPSYHSSIPPVPRVYAPPAPPAVANNVKAPTAATPTLPPPLGLPAKPKKAKTAARLLRETARKLRHRERRRIGRRERRIAQKKAEEEAILAAGGTLPERKEDSGKEDESISEGSDEERDSADENDNDGGSGPIPAEASGSTGETPGSITGTAPKRDLQSRPETPDPPGTRDNKISLESENSSPSSFHNRDEEDKDTFIDIRDDNENNNNDKDTSGQHAIAATTSGEEEEVVTESTDIVETHLPTVNHESTTSTNRPLEALATSSKPFEETRPKPSRDSITYENIESTTIPTLNEKIISVIPPIPELRSIAQIETFTSISVQQQPIADPTMPYQFGSDNAKENDSPTSAHSHEFSFSHPAPAQIAENLDRLGQPSWGPGSRAAGGGGGGGGDRYRPGNSADRDGYGGRDRRRGDNRRGGFKNAPQPWTPLPAHDRPILRVGREKTPEQYHGMTAGDQDDGEEAAMDLDSGDDERPKSADVKDAPDEHEGKRVKTEAPDGNEGTPEKKMDFINMIKAFKNEANLAKRNAISNNEDFISFDAISDDEDSKKKDPPAGILGKPVPTGPAFSHRDFHHGQQEPIRVPTGPKAMEDSKYPNTRDSNRDAPQSSNHHDDRPRQTQADKKQERKKKRTHSEYEVSQEGRRGPSSHNETPWLRPDEGHEKSLYPSVWLHKEIIDFYDYIRPQPYEEAVRHDLVCRVREAVQSEFPDADILSFGSFAAKLYLPSSDMDLVLVSRNFESGGPPKYPGVKRFLFNIRNILVKYGIPQHNQVTCIHQARVPIVKYVDKISGLPVDISFENLSGIRALTTFKRWKEVYPDMPKIVMIIKHFLTQRNMNEVFNGGVGSFSVICLVVSMLRSVPEASSGNQEDGSSLALGRLLMEFLNFYGNKFNHHTLGIHTTRAGYYRKVDQGFVDKQKPYALSIMDPNDPSNDISRGSFRIRDVFSEFAHAHEEMERNFERIYRAPFAERKGASMLDPVIGGDYDYIYKQRRLMQGAFLRQNLGTVEELYEQGVTRPDNDQFSDGDSPMNPSAASSVRGDFAKKKPNKPNKKAKARAALANGQANPAGIAQPGMPKNSSKKLSKDGEPKPRKQKSKKPNGPKLKVVLSDNNAPAARPPRKGRQDRKKEKKAVAAIAGASKGKGKGKGKEKATKMGPHEVITID